MEKIYKAKFWKDRIWIALIPGILGLIFILIGLVMTGVGLNLLLKSEASFWTFIGVFLLFDLPFLVVGGISFYIFLYGIKTKIIINNNFLILDAPLYKKKISIMDIKKVSIEQRSAPIITYFGKGLAPVFFKAISINVIYEKDGKIKTLQFPCWRKGYYFPQIIEDLKKINQNIEI